jgi:hypothetical protein
MKKIKMAEVDVKYALNDTISISTIKRLWLKQPPYGGFLFIKETPTLVGNYM